MQSGDYFEATRNQYGVAANCPFCNDELEYHSFWYSGYGPPPSYSMTCGNCGAHGPTSRGKERDDHKGAREDAVAKWNGRAVPPTDGFEVALAALDEIDGLTMSQFLDGSDLARMAKEIAHKALTRIPRQASSPITSKVK